MQSFIDSADSDTATANMLQVYTRILEFYQCLSTATGISHNFFYKALLYGQEINQNWAINPAHSYVPIIMQALFQFTQGEVCMAQKSYDKALSW